MVHPIPDQAKELIQCVWSRLPCGSCPNVFNHQDAQGPFPFALDCLVADARAGETFI